MCHFNKIYLFIVFKILLNNYLFLIYIINTLIIINCKILLIYETISHTFKFYVF